MFEVKQDYSRLGCGMPHSLVAKYTNVLEVTVFSKTLVAV
jgi:hypothetical protein